MIKTFKGLLADGDQVTIRLRTNNGLTGYKIKKFEVIPETPGASSQESILKVSSVKASTVNATVNFDSPTLLAAAFYKLGSSMSDPGYQTIIFDDKKVNQDIYITHSEIVGSSSGNYYLELEQVKLDLNEATVATLKDMRGRE